MGEYIIEHDDFGYLSNLSKLEWYGCFNEEGGYYSGVQIFDEKMATRIEQMIPKTRKYKVHQVSVYMPSHDDLGGPKPTKIDSPL